MKFRKKPVVIEATQFTHPERWSDAKLHEHGVCQCVDGPRQPLSPWHIHTLEGSMSILPNDWIITGVKGERYACKPDIFAQTYEALADTLKGAR